MTCCLQCGVPPAPTACGPRQPLETEERGGAPTRLLRLLPSPQASEHFGARAQLQQVAMPAAEAAEEIFQGLLAGKVRGVLAVWGGGGWMKRLPSPNALLDKWHGGACCCFEHPENSHPRSCRPPADIQDTIAFPRQAVSMVRSARWLPPKLIASRVRSQFGSKGSGAAAAGGKQRAAKLRNATKQ